MLSRKVELHSRWALIIAPYQSVRQPITLFFLQPKFGALYLRDTNSVSPKLRGNCHLCIVSILSVYK